MKTNFKILLILLVFTISFCTKEEVKPTTTIYKDMADVTISDLPENAGLTGSELVEIETPQGTSPETYVSEKTTAQEIANLGGGGTASNFTATEQALKNSDGTPLKSVAGKQVYRKSFSGNTTSSGSTEISNFIDENADEVIDSFVSINSSTGDFELGVLLKATGEQMDFVDCRVRLAGTTLQIYHGRHAVNVSQGTVNRTNGYVNKPFSGYIMYTKTSDPVL